MFNTECIHNLKNNNDGRYADMENMDIMLNYENSEFLSSDFFDTIRSVEDDLLATSGDDLQTLSDASSPRADHSESEPSTEFTDASVSPSRSVDAIDDSLFDFLTPVQSNFKIKTTPVIISQPKPSNIIIQNPTTKKIVNKQIISTGHIKKIGKKQVLKVQSLTANGKPVILPYNFKIVNTNHLKTDTIHLTSIPTTTPICRRQKEPQRLREESDGSVSANDLLSEVKLTSEEKRLLDKEGIQLPSYHPLTKLEDRELKRIRRKIRNKISAQDSRKRKKEYVDGLEERVRRGSEENRNLMQRVKELQKKNKTLMAHINKLQSLIFNSSSSKATPSTCLMIVMLSVLLVSLPNIRLNRKELAATTDQEQIPVSRSLLSAVQDEDSLNMDEFFVFNKDESAEFNENNTENEILKTIDEMESKFDNFEFEVTEQGLFNTFIQNMMNLFNKNSVEQNGNPGGFANSKGFIEPDIDEYELNHIEPPAKRMKLVDDHYHQHDENFVPLSRKVVSATVQTNAMVGNSKDK